MKNDIHDLGLVLDSRVRLIVIESWQELRVLETIGSLAVQRAQTWYTWNHLEFNSITQNDRCIGF